MPKTKHGWTVRVYDTKTDSIKKLPMSDDQSDAVDTILEGDEEVYRLCGGAGVGKSAVVETLAKELGAKICATTARAALNVGGSTVDSVFCFRRETWKVDTRRLDYVMDNTPKWIIIDESSMIGDKMADCIYFSIKGYNKKVILVGDWAQAPPVKERWPLNSPLLSEGRTLTLTTNHRQHDKAYMDALQEIRFGRISEKTSELFRGQVQQQPQDDEYTYMYGTNHAAAAHNRIRVAKHAAQFGMTTLQLQAEYWSKYDTTLDKEDTFLERSCMSHGENFCQGCRVMTTLNIYDHGYVNGDLGRVVCLFTGDGPEADLHDLQKAAEKGEYEGIYCQTHGRPIGEFVVGLLVELDRNGRHVYVTREMQEILSITGEPIHRVTGFPIRLAWAMTVHKTQGATLEKAYLNTSSLWPEHGLMYVGLSRTKTLEGLLLDNWAPHLVKCDQRIKEYI